MISNFYLLFILFILFIHCIRRSEYFGNIFITYPFFEELLQNYYIYLYFYTTILTAFSEH